MDKAVVHIEILKSEALEIKNIQLIEDFQVDEITTTITHQADDEDEDLDVNPEKLEKQAKKNNE